MAMKPFGVHYLVEFNGAAREALNNPERLEEEMVRAVEKAGASVVGTRFHRFAPEGVTGVILLSESHFSIHTWPEHGYAAVDLFTCGEGVAPEAAFRSLKKALEAEQYTLFRKNRGVGTFSGETGHAKETPKTDPSEE